MLSKTITIIFALALAINLQIAAQNKIRGTVLSDKNEPLVGANIVIKNSTLGTASKPDGSFTISGIKNGRYIIRFSYFGYETIEKDVAILNNDVVLNIKMTATSIDLNAVVITGTRTEKNLKNTPVLTQTISSKELENIDITDISQALEFVVPGIEFNSEAQGKSISLQGLDPQYMLFLVDGERLAGETMGDIDYSRINIANIEQIEVVKGAGSTLYGSNALGGVVNIISKSPVTKLEIDASTRISNYNTQSHRFRIGSKINKITSQLSIVADKTDGYDLLQGNTYRTQEREDAILVNEKIKYAPRENLQFEATASYLYKNRDNTSTFLYDRRNTDFSYGIKALYYINLKSNISVSWNSDNYKLANKITPDSLAADYDNLYSNARVTGNFQLAKWNLLTTGFEYITENLTAPRNSIEGKINTDYVIFAQEDLQITPALNLVGGIRANHNSQYEWHITPQISAMYKIWNLTFRGAYSQGYKTPTLKEKYMNFEIPAGGMTIFLVGDENLKPETSDYKSVSAEYNRNGISFSVSAYQNSVKNMISSIDEPIMKSGRILEYKYANLDSVRIRGIDIMSKIKIAKNFIFSATATISKKIDATADTAFVNVRNFTGKFNLGYNVAPANNYNLNINLQSNFYGSKTLRLMDEISLKEQDIKLDNFSVWRLTSTHRFKSKYFFRLGVDNIFDFIDQSGGYNSGTPGRTFFIGAGINI